MKRVMLSLFVVGLAISLAPQASAQVPGIGGGYRPPTVSPYLNLLRRGTLPAINYQGLVRPQLETNEALRRLQQQATTNQQNIQQLESGEFLPTGHPTQFLNHNRFFLTQTGGTAGGTAGGRPAGASAAGGFTGGYQSRPGAISRAGSSGGGRGRVR
jgi:hypothetical protein